ncbi:tail-anchored protein insertion receptor WRB-like [Cephus cinctus]|uniref:Guided entry of tail-anchored proteins factor 1 n=1 Tax=Cephus cinctus TaxID=211228 RepID=A0AAJ7C970_CEPCN|nr:tail-anchored protein insertion receptor WRB-like [Cephus cinctus]
MSYLIAIATFNCFLDYIAPIIIKFILFRLYSGSKCDRILRDDLLNVRQEMSGISMVDEFSKYAKLQRKYNKLETELKDNVNARMSSRMKARLIITYAFSIFNALVTLFLLYLYRSEPVVILPKGILWPFQSILSWPCSQDNAISLTIWIMISRLVVSICKRADDS